MNSITSYSSSFLSSTSMTFKYFQKRPVLSITILVTVIAIGIFKKFYNVKAESNIKNKTQDLTESLQKKEDSVEGVQKAPEEDLQVTIEKSPKKSADEPDDTYVRV